jgi:hypothetical protein
MHSKKEGAESAVKMQKWWQKAPPKWQSDGKKCPMSVIVVVH